MRNIIEMNSNGTTRNNRCKYIMPMFSFPFLLKRHTLETFHYDFVVKQTHVFFSCFSTDTVISMPLKKKKLSTAIGAESANMLW